MKPKHILKGFMMASLSVIAVAGFLYGSVWLSRHPEYQDHFMIALSIVMFNSFVYIFSKMFAWEDGDE